MFSWLRVATMISDVYIMNSVGDVVDQWLVRRDFNPWPVHPRCVLRQNT